MPYYKEDLGREAKFLIPLNKIDYVEQEINRFLTENYGGSFSFWDNVSGFWHGKLDGKMRLYVIAFVGKERIPALEEFLSGIAKKIGEESIYFKTGDDVCKISPL